MDQDGAEWIESSRIESDRIGPYVVNVNVRVGDDDGGKDGIEPASESRCHVERDGMAFAKCANLGWANQCRHAGNRHKMSEVGEKRVANRKERQETVLVVIWIRGAIHNMWLRRW